MNTTNDIIGTIVTLMKAKKLILSNQLPPALTRGKKEA
jgi:hypothetical protein